MLVKRNEDDTEFLLWFEFVQNTLCLPHIKSNTTYAFREVLEEYGIGFSGFKEMLTFSNYLFYSYIHDIEVRTLKNIFIIIFRRDL